MLPGYTVNSMDWNMLVQSGPFDPYKRLSDYSEEELEQPCFQEAATARNVDSCC